MTFNIKVTIDIEVEVDGTIPPGLDIPRVVKSSISDAVPPILFEGDEVNLFSNRWEVKVGRIRLNNAAANE